MTTRTSTLATWMCSALLALLLVGLGSAPVLAQEDGRQARPGSQEARTMGYYLQHPDAPLPSAVKEQMSEKALNAFQKQRERLRELRAQPDRRAARSKAINGITETQQVQSWVLNQNPNPAWNFDLTGPPQYAGDVDGDGTNDYLYSATARDERTSQLEDRTGKTALYYGGTPAKAPDSLLYVALTPVGDLNGDGHDDAMKIDADAGMVTIYAGSASGYQDSSATLSVNNLPGRSDREVRGFSDLDGDGNEDVLVGKRDNSAFTVIYGASSVGSATTQTYNPSGDPSFTYNTANLDESGAAEIVRLTGDYGRFFVQVDTIDGARNLVREQEFFVEELGGRARTYNLAAVDVDGTAGLELVTRRGRFGSTSFLFKRGSSSPYQETPVVLSNSEATPVGDLDGDGQHDFVTIQPSTGTQYVSYGPSNLDDSLTYDTAIPENGNDVSREPNFISAGGLGDVTGDDRADVGLYYANYSNATVGRRFVSVNASDRMVRTPADVTYPRGHFFDWINETNEIGDFNNDGTNDFAIVRNSLGRVEIFFGGSSIDSAPNLTITSPADSLFAENVTSGDFDGDGTSDVLVGYSVGGDLESTTRNDIYLGGNSPDATADHSVLASDVGFPLTLPRVIGDVNGDGATDWMASDRGFNSDYNVTGQNVAIFFGGSTLPSTPDETMQYPDGFFTGEVSAAVGDVNGDGYDDFAFDNTAAEEMDVYFGGENPSFSPPADLSLPVRPYGGLAGGDFNGDGTSDIAAMPYFIYDNGYKTLKISIFHGGSGIDATADRELLIPSVAGEDGDLDGDGFVEWSIGVLESPGDVDGNGADELIHGSSFFGFSTNALLYRPSTSREPIRVFRAPNQDAALGSQQFIYSAAMGDFTGDGTIDFVPTQYNDENDATRSSRVYRYAPDVAAKSPRPDAPEGLTASATETSIELNWTAVNESNLARYRIYRSTTPFGPAAEPDAFVPYDSVSAGTTTFSDTDVPAAAGYHYRVTAVLDDGTESFFSNGAQAAVPLLQSDLATVADFEDAQRDSSASGGTTIRLDSAEVSSVSNGIAALEVNAGGSGTVTLARRANLPRSDRLTFLLKPNPDTSFTLTLTFVEEVNRSEMSYDVTVPVDSGNVWQRVEVPFSEVGSNFNPVASRSGGNGPFLRLEASANKDLTFHVDEFEFGTDDHPLVELMDFERTTLAYGPPFCPPSFSDTTAVADDSDGFTAQHVEGGGCFGYNYDRLSPDASSDDVLSARVKASPGDSLYVFVESVNGEGGFTFGAGKKVPLPANTWGRIEIPLTALGDDVTALKDPGIFNVGFEARGATPDLLIDDIKIRRQIRPEPPTDLTASATGDSISVSWSAPGSESVESYRVYRGTTPIDPTPGPGAYVPYDTTTTTAFIDTNVTSGTTYSYRVTAVTTEGDESGFSNRAQATPRTEEGLRVSGLQPESGTPGTMVRIYGAGFDRTPSNNTVQFGSVTATVQEGGTTVLYAEVPSGVSGPVQVSVNDGDTTKTAPRLFSAISKGGGTPVSAGSEAFADIGADLVGVDNPALDWGDYDGDGDLDLIATGRDLLVSDTDTSQVASTTLYRNDGSGTFTPVDAGLMELWRGDADWGDYDQDGDLDLLLSGFNSDSFDNPTTVIYRNDGNGTFTKIGAGLKGVEGGSSQWGDYDGDGDLDLVVTGSFYVSELYRNDGNGSFTAVDVGLTGLRFSSADWGDYDGDGDLDLVLSGRDETDQWRTILYRNEGDGTFTAIEPNIPGVTASVGHSVEWGDYDRDGLLDLAVAGYDGSDSITKLYRNAGNDTFTEVAAGFDTGSESLDWGDYDGDGRLDLAITDLDRSPSTRIYRNEGNDRFRAIDANLKGLTFGMVAWGDYDGDGDPDLVSAGRPGTTVGDRLQRSAMIYENGLDAAQTVSVSSDGTKDFGETGTSLNFSGVSGSGTVTVKKQNSPPSDTAGIGEQNVSEYRVTIDASGDLSFSSAEVRLAVSRFGGINDPTQVTIYKRDSVGTGSFTALDTRVGDNGTADDISDDTLYATTDSFSEFALASDTQPLPVELASFEARIDDDRVRLNWTTASEQNNSGFRIQRRDAETEGRGDWETIGRKQGAGTTTEAQSYQFTDANLPYEADALTYRLKQVDTDGSAHFSKTITVERGVTKVQLLGTYPNPARGQATVRYALPEQTETTIRLYDVLGRRVRTVVSSKKEGRHERTLDVSGLSSGVYFLRLRADGAIRTQKLTVVK